MRLADMAGATRTIGFPRSYSQGPGALRQLGARLRAGGFSRPVLVIDPAVREMVLARVAPGLAEQGFAPATLDAPGECAAGAIEALRAKASGADVVVAFGGGKAIDAGKGVALRLGIEVFVCPTAASSDAPTSRLIVLYDDAHRVAGVERLADNPAHVLVDTEVIAAAPPRLFAAGIGDALSKRFEARACAAAGGVNLFGTPPPPVARVLAEAAYATLVHYAAQACRELAGGVPTPALEAVIEATVLLSGLGFEGGGLSLAHALIRGLTTLPGPAARLHGELVAYGTLVQLAYEYADDGTWGEVMGIIDGAGLPASLAELGHPAPLTPAEREGVFEATVATAYSRNLLPPLTPARLAAAMDAVDARRARALARAA